MSRIASTLIIGCALLLPTAARADDIHWLTSADDAWAETTSAKRPLLLFVTRPNCGYCTKMKATTFSDPAVVQQINGQFVPLMLDASVDPRFAQQLGVRSYPTVLVISPEHGLLDSFKGYLPAERLQVRLEHAQHHHRTARAPSARGAAKTEGQTQSTVPAPPAPPIPPHLEPGATREHWKPVTQQ